MIDVCLLGCGGMMPLPDRRLTALLIRVSGKMVLLDCGEGTQVGLQLAGWGLSSLEAVCFTHYHADHIAGLPGLLATLGNSGKKTPLCLYGPPGLFSVMRGLSVLVPPLPFETYLVEGPDSRKGTIRIGEAKLSSIPADHTAPCFSYRLQLDRAGKFDEKRALKQEIPQCLWKRLQKGESIQWNGRRIESQMVLGPRRKGLKLCYCTDTRPTEEFLRFCRASDLLICEGMYGQEEKRPDAIRKKHMTFSEAAALARDSGSKELWLTHYSPSIKDPFVFLDLARDIFPNAQAGEDLKKKTLFFA
ncbi:MAG: ribonuclease Z [Oscillospiraceae bacterium]|nr:ribonuclease Z [Oscillospiraceae bacterium]